MSEEVLKEIANLLENILVFETKFKAEILAKVKNMSDAKVNGLKEILLHVGEWQKKVLEKKIQEDPDFYNKIINSRKQIDQEILDLYKQKLNDEDRKKMDIILNKMKTI